MSRPAQAPAGPFRMTVEVTWDGRRHPTRPGRSFLIGRDDAADLTIAQRAVSRRHLLIEPTPNGWDLRDLSTNGTYVDGRRITRMPLTGPVTATLGTSDQAPRIGIRPDWVPLAGAPGPTPGAQRAAGPASAATPSAAAPTVGAPPPGAPGPGAQSPGAQPPGAQPPGAQPPAGAPPPGASPAGAPPHAAPLAGRPPAGAPPVGAPPVGAPPVGAPPIGAPPVGAPPPGARSRPSSRHDLSTRTLRIGRDPANDVVLGDLLVSRRHAELRRNGPRWQLVDLGSPNGTFVNGRRVTETLVAPGDMIGIGHSLLELQGDHLVEYVDDGEITFRADGLVVRTPDGKQLLDRIGFSLEQRSLLAVVGPSGAGKSTLLRALTGFRPADEGRVEYAGRNLYADYDELRQRIGLVPQDDILHPQLTVRRALGYAARLRFPSDVTGAERDRRVDEVIAELGLTEQATQRISSLSGGQRKRTSVALELLTRPSLLFLDEPTSGLDPGLDKSVMRTLRGLADDSRTVVVVTHSVANLDVCDRLLLLAPGGTVAFFGPPNEALTYFGVSDFAEVFLMLERERGADWGERFRRSPFWIRYVGAPARRADRPASGAPPATPAPPPRRSGVRQFVILSRRYLAVIAADRQYTIFMLALPLVLSLLAHALPGQSGLSLAEQARLVGQGARGSPQTLLLVLVIGASLMGSAASIRELVKEREIYRRERAIGESRWAYLASKLVVLSLVTGAQAVLLGLLGNLGRPSPDSSLVLAPPMLEIVVALVGVTVGSMTVGLAVSAAIDNADRGMPLLVLLAMLQFILSSALIQIGGSPVLAQLSWLVPARWGFALGASTVAIPTGPGTGPYTEHDPFWDHASSTWLLVLAALVGVALLFSALTAVLLARLEPRSRT